MKTIHTFGEIIMSDIRKNSIKNLNCQTIKLNVVNVSQGSSWDTSGCEDCKECEYASKCKGDVLLSLPLVRVKCLNEFDYTDRI